MENSDREKIRLQVYDLTSSDLANTPAWLFALEEEGVSNQDEATVRPYSRFPVDPSDGLMVVRARFKLSDGSKMTGYVCPPLSESWDLGLLQPVVVTNQNQIPLWFGMYRPDAEEFRRLLRALGKTKEQVFPLTYESDVELVNGPFRGAVEGFSFLSGGKIEVAAF